MIHFTKIMWIGNCFVIWNIITARPRWMTVPQTWAFVLLFMGSSIFGALGNRLKARPAYVFSMMILSIFIMFTTPSFEALLLAECGAFMFRVMLGMKYFDLRDIVIWNLVYALCAVYAFSECARNGEDAYRFVMYEVCYCCTVIVLAFRAAEAVRLEARLEADKATLRGERSGLRELMELVCDVVVNLDPQLRLSDAASRLSAMVNFRGEASLLGMRLQDFMPDEADKAGFEGCVLATSGMSDEEAGTKPRMLHARLRDSLGNLIKVELFCASIQTLLGTSYVVGIREFGDGIAELADRTPPLELSGGPSPEQGSRRSRQPKQTTRARRVSKRMVGEIRGDDALSESDSASSQSVCSGGSAQKLRLFPTTMMGLDFALATVMGRIEVDVGEASDCCPFHLRLRMLREATERLQAFDCATAFGADENLQCQSCGFLNRDGLSGLRGKRRTPRDKVCFACEEALDFDTARPQRTKLVL
eukprot:CAMPEP_0176026062 /NCGR_PEP_ID=MMETSP0120_2-20121206/12762_1 /TAXON_ID=160619 /ORGANISM="Kryptoperidinium foliaceum, Strain CCMP 1326" /LENGTH=475 /DNA_ID=CAMNT_0017359257 /DNA_START=335 /DNA_END=1762 /DNA_ORIENTATION=-